NAAQGITRFFVTDDNFARNRNWEAILDRLIYLREREKFDLRLLFQVDTLCHRIPRFIEKAARAGCTVVFIGLENINPESLMGTKKRQNKIWNIPRCCWPGGAITSLPMPATSSASRPTPGNRSPAISRSSKRNCRSTSLNSSAS